MPDALLRSYKSTLDSFNNGLWVACATSCRRTLEGMVKFMLDEYGVPIPPNLSKGLQTLFDNVDLREPLIALTEQLRHGGNLGAHFDLENEPDEMVTSAMVDLLDYFIEYVYVLGERADQLKSRIAALRNE